MQRAARNRDEIEITITAAQYIDRPQIMRKVAFNAWQ